MKTLAYVIALGWLVMFLAYCFTDYVPSDFTIGSALLMGALTLTNIGSKY